MRENNHTRVVCVIILIKIDKVLNLKLFSRKQMHILWMTHVLYKESCSYNGNLYICVEPAQFSRTYSQLILQDLSWKFDTYSLMMVVYFVNDYVFICNVHFYIEDLEVHIIN